jgi:drug/metabolite transporter (DMT)-like permease
VKLRTWTALWTIYLVWGSTYLGIKVMVRTMPAFLSAGLRFGLAGAILAAVLALRGRSLRVSRRELAASAAMGATLLTFGVGVVTLAETRIASSVAAIIASSVPLQVVLLRSLARERVSRATLAGVVAGLCGVALVVVPASGGGSSLTGLLIMLSASVSWSLGSFFSRRLPLPADPFVATAWEMLAAGLFLGVLGLAAGEAADVHPAAFSGASLGAFAYLVVAGSLVGFSAYVWLLHHVPISKVVTHQYVNPVVAVLLGAAFLSEKLAWTTLLGAVLIVGSVFAVVRQETVPAAEPALEPVS